MTVKMAKAGVQTRFWPLYEIEDGEWKLSVKVREPKPLEDWLKPQGRYKHLFAPGNEELLAEVQQDIDDQWARLMARCGVE